MSRSWLSRLVLRVVLGSFVLGGCGSSSPPAVDYRGDPLCQDATAVADGTSCDLSVTMHAHTYLLRCDLSQRTCDCSRDGRRVDSSNFGGSATPSCTLGYLNLAWSDCCGTPQ